MSGHVMVGYSMLPVDALGRVTGQARYAADFSMPDMLKLFRLFR
jgi:CO/xanthine dehydrogenase Mo-binding subunit